MAPKLKQLAIELCRDLRKVKAGPQRRAVADPNLCASLRAAATSSLSVIFCHCPDQKGKLVIGHPTFRVQRNQR
jgi:hypothetical protein